MKKAVSLLVITGLALLPVTIAFAKAPKSPHAFKRSVEVVGRSNSNISLAPSSNSGFSFASPKDFDEEDEGEEGDEAEDEDEDEDGDDFDFDFDDFGADYDDLELAESDNPDEDGDGVDDLIDDDQDSGDGDDGEDGEGDSSGTAGAKAGARKRSSSVERYTTKFGFGHKYTASKTVSLMTGLKTSFDQQPGRSDLNKFNGAFSFGPEFKVNKQLKIKAGVSYVYLQQDSNSFLDTWVGTLGFDFDVSKTVGLGAAYNYQNKDVVDPAAPDAIVNTLTFGMDWKITGNDILALKYSPKVEDSSVVTRDKDVDGFEIAYSRKLPWDMVLGVGYKRDNVDYDNLPRPRSDEIDTYAFQLEKDFNKLWSGKLAYETRELDSNINSKDGKNRSVVLSFGVKF